MYISKNWVHMGLDTGAGPSNPLEAYVQDEANELITDLKSVVDKGMFNPRAILRKFVANW